MDRDHPDRLGEQMLGLLPFFKLALAELQEAHHTFGLVVDYACLPQKPFASDEEAQRADHPAGPSPAGSLLAQLLGTCSARALRGPWPWGSQLPACPPRSR